MRRFEQTWDKLFDAVVHVFQDHTTVADVDHQFFQTSSMRNSQ